MRGLLGSILQTVRARNRSNGRSFTDHTYCTGTFFAKCTGQNPAFEPRTT